MTESLGSASSEKVSDRVVTRELFACLQNRFRDGYHVLSEVSIDGTKDGGKFSRQSVDAIIVGIWRSTGFSVESFELKASRQDLLKELRTPEKAQAAMNLVDKHWLVVPELALIKGDGKRARDLTPELPQAWGILRRAGNSLYTVRKALPLPNAGKPLDRRLVAAMVTRATTVAFPEQSASRRRGRRRRAA